jgi:hypothetical protein
LRDSLGATGKKSGAAECAESVLGLMPSNTKQPQTTPSTKKNVSDGQDWRLIVFRSSLKSCEKLELRIPCPPLEKKSDS